MYMFLTQALQKAAAVRPNAPATVSHGRTQSYAQLAERTARLGAALRAQGMGDGDRVGMLALNSDRYLEYYMGVWWGGGVVNPVNTRWSPVEMAYSLDDCDTRILIVDDAFVDIAQQLLELSTSLVLLIYAGDQLTPQGMLNYESLISGHAPMADAIRSDDDLAGVFYTGGTTGFPKGVMLSHTNLLANAMGSLAELFIEEDSRFLHVAPLFHLAALTIVLRVFLRAGCHVVLPSFAPLAVLEAVSRERITGILVVPTMLQMLLALPDLKLHDCSSLKLIGYGGSPIGEAVLEAAMLAFPQAQFAQGYGMTEMAAGITFLLPYFHTEQARSLGKLQSAGRPICGVEVRIAGEGEGDAMVGDIGEILVRGASMMLGYWNKPDETAHTLRGGWLHTGDAGYLDADGFLHVVDRLKDMIVTGGENVYSAEVENALLKHPGVAACAVIAVPDPKWGEAVHAVIVPKPGQQLAADEIKAHCRAWIAGFKCPRSIEFRTQLPVSGAGKVLKFALRAAYLAAAQPQS